MEVTTFSFDVLGGRRLISGLQDQCFNFKLLGRGYHLRSLFSARASVGIKIRKMVKYKAEASWPIIIKGCSTG